MYSRKIYDTLFRNKIKPVTMEQFREMIRRPRGDCDICCDNDIELFRYRCDEKIGHVPINSLVPEIRKPFADFYGLSENSLKNVQIFPKPIPEYRIKHYLWPVAVVLRKD